ncbi:MAG: type I 3-dehydroquinate dehydratase [Verrucomicrobia bacterium]|nr:type I 3-dehydroquinate dehydratase [Verrucomicrobiota bacterium]
MLTPPFAGAVVGTIPSPGALAAALKLPRKAVDFLEVRVDAFAGSQRLEALEKSLPLLKAPLILTVRHPLEGGAAPLSLARRRALFKRFLPYASFVDVELRSAAGLRAITEEARLRGLGVLFSHHDFQKTPSLARLGALRRAAALAGADVFKVAAVTHTARDLATLLDFLSAHSPAAPLLAVMGMGKFGKVSRVALGKAGSVLNYGYLDKPQVSGQWAVAVLKERLREC